METVICSHCDKKEVIIKIDGKAYTTFMCKGCGKYFTLKN